MNITGRQILEVLKGATEAELDAPIEISVRTYTKATSEYPNAFETRVMHGGGLRITASFPEGVTISKRKVGAACGVNSTRAIRSSSPSRGLLGFRSGRRRDP